MTRTATANTYIALRIPHDDAAWIRIAHRRLAPAYRRLTGTPLALSRLVEEAAEQGLADLAALAPQVPGDARRTRTYVPRAPLALTLPTDLVARIDAARDGHDGWTRTGLIVTACRSSLESVLLDVAAAVEGDEDAADRVDRFLAQVEPDGRYTRRRRP